MTFTTNDARLLNQRVDESLRPMPDYADDPSAWEYRFRQLAHGWAKRRGWLQDFSRSAFVKDEVLRVCAKRGVMGDLRACLRILNQQLRMRGFGGQGEKRRRVKALFAYANEIGVPIDAATKIIESRLKSIEVNDNAIKTALRGAATIQAPLIPDPAPARKASSPFGEPLGRSAEEIEAERQRGLTALQKLQEEKVSDQPTTVEPTAKDFIRGNEQPEEQPVHWIDNANVCKAFWATVTPWIKWAGHTGEPKEFVHTEVGKIHDWTDGYDPLVERVTKTAIVRKMEAGLGRELTGSDFLNATDYKSLRSAMDAGVSDGSIRERIDAYLATAKSEPQTGPNASVGNVTPETPAKPVAGKSEPQSAPVKPDSETKALAIVPKQVEVIRDTAFTGRALLPSEPEWRTMGEVATTGFKSGLLPQIKSAEAAKFIVETGRELGVPPSVALRKLYLIHGQIAMAVELMWAMVLDSGKLEDFEIVEAADHCTVTVQRKGAKKPYTTTFSLEMARKIMTKEDDGSGQKKSIPLAEKYNWRQMPGVMCKWRALSAACRTIFPDVTLGIYSKEEMEDAIDFNADPDQYERKIS